MLPHNKCNLSYYSDCCVLFCTIVFLCTVVYYSVLRCDDCLYLVRSHSGITTGNMVLQTIEDFPQLKYLAIVLKIYLVCHVCDVVVST